MARSKSSHQWLKEHFNDPFVKKAQKEGYRSRAAFKLIEIQNKDKLIKPGMLVIDLGAAPGGWSQVLREWVGEKGKVVALDILPMPALGRVTFIQGDFHETETWEKMLAATEGQKVDVIVSDMAPNTSGLTDVDQPRAILLAELSLALAEKILKKQGAMLVKAFHGEGYDAFLKILRTRFKQVMVRKPQASRSRSRENYLVAKGFMV